jgi:hypothetical protein
LSSYTWTSHDLDVLVALAAATSPPIAPSDCALVCFEESGFDPANSGPAAASPPVGGLNQMSSTNLRAMGITRDAWLAMGAAEQLPHVFAFWRDLCETFNGGTFASDAGQLLALNFLPGAYRAAHAQHDPNAPIAGKNGPYAWAYTDNPGLDPRKTGAITVNTCREYLAAYATAPQNAARWAQLLADVHAASARAAGLAPPSGGGGAPPPSSGGPPTLPGGKPPTAGGSGGFLAIALATLVTWFVVRGRGA